MTELWLFDDVSLRYNLPTKPKTFVQFSTKYVLSLNLILNLGLIKHNSEFLENKNYLKAQDGFCVGKMNIFGLIGKVYNVSFPFWLLKGSQRFTARKYYEILRLVIFQNIMLLKFSYEVKNLVEKLSLSYPSLALLALLVYIKVRVTSFYAYQCEQSQSLLLCFSWEWWLYREIVA